MYMAHAHTQTVEKRTPNKLLVSEIKTILDNYKIDPHTWNIDYIAQKYQIDRSKIGKPASNEYQPKITITHGTFFKTLLFRISAKLLGNYTTPHMSCKKLNTDADVILPKPVERVHGQITIEKMAELIAVPGKKKYLTLAEKMGHINRKN